MSSDTSSAFFGLAVQYDKGSVPSVALNEGGTALEVHKNEAGSTLYYHVGRLLGASVAWGPSRQYDTGSEPRCALSASGVALEVHKNEAGSTLYYHVGRVAGDAVQWGPSRKYDSGITPAVAMNDAGVVVEVHQTQSPFSNGLYYHVGRVSGDSVEWGSSHEYDSGSAPAIAVNKSGVVVEVHQSQSAPTLWYHVGLVSGDKLDLGGSVHFADGVAPSVALTDDGIVIVTWASITSLMQRTGHITGRSITWHGEARQYDTGVTPSVAAAGKMAIQVHPSEDLFGLWTSTSLITDRAAWMADRLGKLGGRPLSGLVLPAAHDAGMYVGGIAVLARTQDLTIQGQLENGVRWFDLRPRWTGSKFVLHHGSIDGSDLSEVLADIKSFAQGHRELIVLKLSHLDGMEDSRYADLTAMVSAAIGPWLVTTRPAGKRLADVTLSEYLAQGTAVIVVVADDYARSKPAPGFWVYRDWDADRPAEGDLRVYDSYSNKMVFEEMRADQVAKFESYDGKCQKDPSVPCELFLLSWTLTPPTDVRDVSAAANRALGAAMATLPVPNPRGKIINLVYVDYVEYARVADVALFLNGAPTP